MRANDGQSLRIPALRSLKTNLCARVSAAPMATEALYVFANAAIGGCFGVIFWVVAARLYSLAAVGLASATIAAMTLIATASLLGSNAIILRYLPVAGQQARRLAGIGTLVPALISACAAALFLALPAGRTLTTALAAESGVALLMPVLLASATAVGLIQDTIFIARARAKMVLYRGLAITLLRFVALIGLPNIGAAGLVSIYALSLLLAVALGPGAWRWGEQPASLSGLKRKHMLSYGAFSYISGLFSQTPQLLYPMLIVIYVSPLDAGAFAFAWMAASLLMMLAPSVASVLTAQLAAASHELEQRLRRTLLGVLAVVIPLCCLVFVCAWLLAPLLLVDGVAQLMAYLPLLLLSVSFYSIVRLETVFFLLTDRYGYLLLLNGSIAAAAIALPLLMLDMGVHGLELGWLLSQVIGVVMALALRRRASRQPQRQGQRGSVRAKHGP